MSSLKKGSVSQVKAPHLTVKREEVKNVANVSTDEKKPNLLKFYVAIIFILLSVLVFMQGSWNEYEMYSFIVLYYIGSLTCGVKAAIIIIDSNQTREKIPKATLGFYLIMTLYLMFFPSIVNHYISLNYV
jgi:hypothetical protein